MKISLILRALFLLSYSVFSNYLFCQNSFETIEDVRKCITGKWVIQNKIQKSEWYIYYENGMSNFYIINYDKNNNVEGEYSGNWDILRDVPKLKFRDGIRSWDVRLSSCNRFVSMGVDIYIKVSNEDIARNEMNIKLKKRNLTVEIQKLSAINNCVTCHKIDKKLIGPSFFDITQKYGKDKLDFLIESAIKGNSKNVWGDIPNWPSPYANREELEKMYKYIFELKGMK
jgi:cytochrome c551/c552